MKRNNWLEWLTLAISTVVVLGTFGYLVTLALAGHRSDANLAARVLRIERIGDEFDVTVVVDNLGDRTAEEVQIEVVLSGSGTEKPETANFSVPYVPYHSTRTGRVRFRRDPSKGNLVATVRGYQNP